MKAMKTLMALLNLLLISLSLVLPGQVRGNEDWMERGLSGLKTQHFEEAIEAFSKAIEINPDRIEAYNNRGIAWCNHGDYDRAIADYNKALEIDPRCANVYNNRGGAWFYKGEYDRAIHDFDKALGINPNFAKAYSNRGAGWFCKGDFKLAVDDYNKALEINPNSADTNRQLAWILSVYSGEKIKTSTIEPPRHKPAGTPSAAPKTEFSIQVGAFQSRENAETLTAGLKEKGYAARLMPLESWSKKILYTVRIGVYTTRREAEEKAETFSVKENLPSTVRPAHEL